MKAICTKYHGPTDTKGSRYSASDEDGNKVTLSANYSLDVVGNHERAAQALMDKMGWKNQLLGGGWGSKMYWVMVPETKKE
jgi:hypothetical protein